MNDFLFSKLLGSSGSVSGSYLISFFEKFVYKHDHIFKFSTFITNLICKVFHSNKKILIISLFLSLVIKFKFFFLWLKKVVFNIFIKKIRKCQYSKWFGLISISNSNLIILNPSLSWIWLLKLSLFFDKFFGNW